MRKGVNRIKAGKICATALICALMAVILSVPARAAEGSAKWSLWMKDRVSEIQDEDTIEISSSQIGPRAFGSIDVTVSAHKARKSESRFPMEAGQTVTLDCRYTPNSASVDFGLIAPDGYFYYVNSTSGSINQTIQIVERGHYTLAVSNNSSEAVSIAGYVYY